MLLQHVHKIMVYVFMRFAFIGGEKKPAVFILFPSVEINTKNHPW
jgi:hypothetical protein